VLLSEPCFFSHILQNTGTCYGSAAALARRVPPPTERVSCKVAMGGWIHVDITVEGLGSQHGRTAIMAAMMGGACYSKSSNWMDVSWGQCQVTSPIGTN
jgi:hypothetical protein